MSNIFLIDLESVPTRYTVQWKSHVPNLLRKEGHNVQILSGPTDIPSATTPGAFLNFGGTNVYKSAQVERMGRLFCTGSVHPGDHFLFTDAWHPGIINLKYMSELLNIPVKIHALWHAGSYDPHDFLGRLIGDAPWVRYAEKSFFAAIDHNYFATKFHIKLFIENLLDIEFRQGVMQYMQRKKILQTGWPMEYMNSELESHKDHTKKDLILFPHRIAPEKQVEIFRDLKNQLPQYDFIVCQDTPLTKDEYHKLLGEAKLIFSSSLQETLGIGCYEGTVVNAIPMVPDRLSYSEMYNPIFKYPSDWTADFSRYQLHKTNLCERITFYMENYQSLVPEIQKQKELLNKHYFSASELLNNII